MFILFPLSLFRFQNLAFHDEDLLETLVWKILHRAARVYGKRGGRARETQTGTNRFSHSPFFGIITP